MTKPGSLFLLLALAGTPVPDTVRSSSAKIHGVLGGPAGYIDLRNTGATTLDIGGWSVQACTGGAAPVELATMPAGSELPAGEHFLITAQGFGGPVRQLVVETIAGDGEILLDRRGAKVDSVGWAPSSPCRENQAAVPCPGLAQARNAVSRDTDDNKADFGCVRPAG
ncbi:lamin tail domain-containing protein [Amycolatopsis sp. EV170708-02-1]|uniref:lamin tail domain-containing protein n=1 Tax=Amycolatopsis sp. EV170708-02-1 TaxID=2919322 RepID=UPI001F0BE624|nr:lamin tail domain-containing protein [Amycolatopsis sp. EV170708-02-1]UMP00754.1 lamin tail domain-containing protein [Amycolatopsis sp. EV170708-02-1]